VTISATAGALTFDACVRHLQMPRDIRRARTARAQLVVGDCDRTATSTATPRLDHVPHVGRAPQVAEIHLHAPADAHPAVLRRPDIDAFGRRAATGVEVLESAVFARLLCHDNTATINFISPSHVLAENRQKQQRPKSNQLRLLGEKVFKIFIS